MTDEDAFLRKLLDNPADDVVRLVYADWLEEHEELAKAEFLRLEAEVTTASRRRRRQVNARLQALAADLDTKWLAVVGKMQIENCRSGGTTVLYWGRREGKSTYLCPKRWERLQATREDGVRFCESCRENVYYCDTIQTGRDHVGRGHCVVVDLGVIRKSRDLEPKTMVMGRFTADYFDREEERLRLDAVSEKREQAKRPPDDPV